MGLPCRSIVRALPNYSKLVNSHANLQVFSHLKQVLILILYHLLLLLTKALCDHHLIKREPDDDDDDHNRDRDYLPNVHSGSMLPVPVHYLAKSTIKKQLPAVRYGSLNRERSIGKDSSCGDDLCIVCINQIEASQEVRVLLNCSHVFHKDCLDAWVDQGQGTCPLCRSNLLILTPQNHHDQRDPSRMDRMIYLFGHDCPF